MLTEITGDILDVKDGIICHQVNFFGVMGGGVAAAIRKRVLTPVQYQEYVDYCYKAGSTALGSVQFLGDSSGLLVANLFCQNAHYAAYANDDFSLTNYGCMRACFTRVRDTAFSFHKTVYIPYKIGCGIAGGDWPTVKSIIAGVFEESPVEAVIVRREGD